MHPSNGMADLTRMLESYEGLAVGLTLFSMLCFAGSVMAIPVLVARAPVDYFAREQATHQRPLVWRVVRNLFGASLLMLGVLMLVLPGQGLLTIFVSLTFLDLPGKQRLMRELAHQEGVVKALQWLRERAHKPPFDLS